MTGKFGNNVRCARYSKKMRFFPTPYVKGRAETSTTTLYRIQNPGVVQDDVATRCTAYRNSISEPAILRVGSQKRESSTDECQTAWKLVFGNDGKMESRRRGKNHGEGSSKSAPCVQRRRDFAALPPRARRGCMTARLRRSKKYTEYVNTREHGCSLVESGRAASVHMRKMPALLADHDEF